MVVIKIDHLSPRCVKEEIEDKAEITIMIDVGNWIGLDQVVVIGIEIKL